MALRAVPFNGGTALLGGYGYSDKKCLSDIGLLDSEGQERSAGVQMHLGRNHFEAVPIGNGQVLVIGGYCEGSDTLSDVEAIDLKHKAVQTWPPLPNPVELFTSVKLGDKIAIIGGLRNQGVTRTWGSIQLVDLKSHKATLNNVGLHESRFGHDSVWLPRLKKVLIAGGKHVDQGLNGKATYTALRSLELWAASGKMEPGGDMTVARDRPRLFVMADGKVLIIGGRSEQGFPREIELYNPATRRSKVVASLSAGRMAASIRPYGGLGLLIAGGWKYDPDAACAFEFLDFKTLSVSTVGRTKVCRAENAMVWLRRGVFALIGGKDAFKGRAPESYRFKSTELFAVTP